MREEGWLQRFLDCEDNPAFAGLSFYPALRVYIWVRGGLCAYSVSEVLR